VNNNKEEKDDIVHSIGEASWHMTQKIRAFMYAKNIRELKVDYNKLKKKIDLNEKIKECILRVAKKNRRSDDFAMNFDDAPKIIFAHEEHITFLLDELIQRAINNTKPGQIIIVGLLNVSWNEVLVTINDFGTCYTQIDLTNKLYKKIDFNSDDEGLLTMNFFEKIIKLNNGEISFYKKQTTGSIVLINLMKHIE
jgi:K+-sensing histidine kinase KdpD